MTDKIFLVKIPEIDEYHFFLGMSQECNKVELTPELEEEVLLNVLTEYGTGTEEGYIDDIVKSVFKELKESVDTGK